MEAGAVIFDAHLQESRCRTQAHAEGFHKVFQFLKQTECRQGCTIVEWSPTFRRATVSRKMSFYKRPEVVGEKCLGRGSSAARRAVILCLNSGYVRCVHRLNPHPIADPPYDQGGVGAVNGHRKHLDYACSRPDQKDLLIVNSLLYNFFHRTCMSSANNALQFG